MKSFNKAKAAIIGVIVVIFIGWLVIGAVSFYNKTVDYQTNYEKNMKDESSYYDNIIRKAISGGAQISSKASAEFKEIVRLQMEGRKDSGVLFKWVQEVNYGAGYSDVVRLYENLQRTIEATRTEFVNRESLISAIAEQQNKYVKRFPNNIYAKIFGVKPIDFKPITSSAMENINKTRKDDDEDIFN